MIRTFFITDLLGESRAWFKWLPNSSKSKEEKKDYLQEEALLHSQNSKHNQKLPALNFEQLIICGQLIQNIAFT